MQVRYPWKTTNSNSFMGNKGKTSMRYQISVVYEFTFPMDLTVEVLAKLIHVSTLD